MEIRQLWSASSSCQQDTFLGYVRFKKLSHNQFHHRANSAGGSTQVPEKMDEHVIMSGISLGYKLGNPFKDGLTSSHLVIECKQCSLPGR